MNIFSLSLLVGESNPGHRRDRARCYQLHQRGSHNHITSIIILDASLAQLGERQTEDLKVPGSIPGGGIYHSYYIIMCLLSSDGRALAF